MIERLEGGRDVLSEYRCFLSLQESDDAKPKCAEKFEKPGKTGDYAALYATNHHRTKKQKAHTF